MKWLWRSSIAKNLLGSFLVFLFLVMAISLIVNYTGVEVVRNQVAELYTNSLLQLSEQFDASLKKFEELGNALLADNDINALNQSPDDIGILWDYSKLLKQLTLFSMTNDLEANISVFLRNKDGCFHLHPACSGSAQIMTLLQVQSARHPPITGFTALSPSAAGPAKPCR